MSAEWCQVFVEFNDWNTAEHTAITKLGPVLAEAESAGLISAWFFMRKAPCWRVRFLPHDERTTQAATDLVHQRLDALSCAGQIARWVATIYEPETHAFGGPAAMDLAHRLFHQDARHVLDYLGSAHATVSDQRRELSILLACLLLRSAGLDWHEQGDVWTRVAEHRTLPPDIPPGRLQSLEPALRRLTTVDTAALIRDNRPLAFLADWAAAFTDAGNQLREFANTGILRRGLRAVLIQHVIFAWNRHGLPHATQSLIANTAKTVVFGE
jgi:thiopeptide-type bacteriocin biosynthesis protein